MPATLKCRGCGADVPANAPLGHCPKCLLELGLDPLPEGKAAPPSALASECSFGDYELIEQIGRGGMGVIYKARQLTLNRLVALKMVRAGEFASATLIQRFHLEAEAAANLHHPNIVPIYETGEHQGEHFFSMELIDGTGLDRYITRGGFSVEPVSGKGETSLRPRQELIARIMAKVARAVDYAHQHGVLHRDLKPSNVILDSRGEPHLTDFGVAKVIGHAGSSLTASGAIMGTPSYMSPEQAAGQSKHLTTAADVYSLGAILYAMLTGCPPFRADTPVETLKQVVEQEPKHPSTFKEGLDRDLATICMKCLEKEPQRRYPSAVALAEDLERWLRREPIQARPVNNAERLWRWCRRNPNVAALGAAVALLLVALAIGATVFAVRIKSFNDLVERNNRQLRKHLAKVYSDPETTSFVIESEDRRALFGQGPAPRVSGLVFELTFVEHIYEHPTNMLIALSPIFDEIEEDLSRQLQRRVTITMRLFKNPSQTYDALESTNAIFGRMGPASYIYLADRNKGARILAMQDHRRALTLALFTRTNSEVSRLHKARPDIPLAELLSNRSLALTHSNSTTGNYMAKRYLASKGVYATNLSRYAYMGGQRQVRDAVAGSFDVGAGNKELVDDHPELRVIAEFEVPNLGRCWVAGKGLEATIEQHLRDWLLECRDTNILGKLESEVKGFKELDQAAFEQLRQIIGEAAAFDAGKKMSP